MTNLLYKEILADYLPEFKRICKVDIKILMDNHPIYKKRIACYFIKTSNKSNWFSSKFASSILIENI